MPVADVTPPDEAKRMAAVRRYNILDTPPDGAFDRITALAARRFGVPIAIVSNDYIRVPVHPLVKRVVVGSGFDAADDWIDERANAGAIVVTADILLAERCLKQGATVISPNGKPFTASSIGATFR